MKKYLVILVTFMLVVLSSCSNDVASVVTPISSNEVENQLDAESLTALQGKIALLNDSIHTQQLETRGIGKFFRWLKNIVVTDAVGALWGLTTGNVAVAIGGAALCSGATAIGGALGVVDLDTRANVKKDLVLNTDLNDLVFAKDEKELALQDSVGYFHNKLLINTFKENNFSIEELPQATVQEFNDNINSAKLSSSDTAMLNTEYKKFQNIQKKYAGNDFDDYTKYLGNCYPDLKGEISVLAEFMNGLADVESGNSQTEYVKTVLKLVDESKLSDKLKQALRNSLIVGNASKKLWEVNEHED